jgi:hypothetical protein
MDHIVATLDNILQDTVTSFTDFRAQKENEPSVVRQQDRNAWANWDLEECDYAKSKDCFSPDMSF